MMHLISQQSFVVSAGHVTVLYAMDNIKRVKSIPDRTTYNKVPTEENEKRTAGGNRNVATSYATVAIIGKYYFFWAQKYT